MFSTAIWEDDKLGLVFDDSFLRTVVADSYDMYSERNSRLAITALTLR